MSRPFPLLLVAVPLLLIAGLTLAAPVECPLVLGDGAVQVARPPSEWTAVPSQAVRLSSGGLLRGRPEDWGYLRPERTLTNSGGESSSNDFAPGEEKWLWCGYGGAGALQIAKRLPDAATVCTVTHKATKRDGIVRMFATCR